MGSSFIPEIQGHAAGRQVARPRHIAQTGARPADDDKNCGLDKEKIQEMTGGARVEYAEKCNERRSCKAVCSISSTEYSDICGIGGGSDT